MLILEKISSGLIATFSEILNKLLTYFNQMSGIIGKKNRDD